MFENILNSFPQTLSEKEASSFWNQWRKDHQNKLKSTPFPTRSLESWKYTNLKDLSQYSYELPSSHFYSDEEREKLMTCKHFCCTSIVLSNGRLQKDLSDFSELEKGIEISTSRDLLENTPPHYHKWLHNFTLPHGSPSESYFTTLNNALFSESLVIRVKKGVTIEKPLHIIHSSHAQNPLQTPLINTRITVLLEENAELNVIEEHIGEGRTLHNPMTEILIDDQARLKYAKIQTESQQSYHISHTHIKLRKDSSLECLTYSSGGRLSRHNLTVTLGSPGANAQVNGLYLVNNEQHLDNHTHIDHLVPNTQSQQLYKGILNDQSRAIFDGKITIHPRAQKSNSSQLNNNLLLSKNSEADSKPNLEIHADDVKATHGSTIGQMNDEEIFYFLSRGISRKQALEMLSFGFVNEVTQKMSQVQIRNYIESLVKKRFQEFI